MMRFHSPFTAVVPTTRDPEAAGPSPKSARAWSDDATAIVPPWGGSPFHTPAPDQDGGACPASASSYRVDAALTAHPEDNDGGSSEESATGGEEPMECSWSAAHASMINNIAGKALRARTYRRSLDMERRLREASGFPVDPSQGSYHARRVAKLRQFIRRLFHPLGSQISDDDLSSSTPGAPSGGRCGNSCVAIKGQQIAESLLELKAVRLFFMLLVWYAMLGPDVAAMQGYTAQYNDYLAAWNTCVLLFFSAEVVLNCMAVEAYARSARFWVDIVATCSIIGDTSFGQELINSDAVAGARVVRLFRMSRSARLPRMLSAFRNVQILRLIPKLLAYFETGRRELALLQMKKRLQHVLMHLDEDGSGYLSRINAAYFQLAFEMEFGDGSMNKDAPASSPKSLWASTLRLTTDSLDSGGGARSSFRRSSTAFVTSLRRSSSALFTSLPSFRNSSPTNTASSVRRSSTQHQLKCSPSVTSESPPKAGSANLSKPISWSALTRELMSGQTGKAALDRCMDDIKKLHDGTKAVGDLISCATLRVCMIVLFMLVVLSVMQSGGEDMSSLQGLTLLHNAYGHYQSGTVDSALSLGTLCDLVRRYASRSPGRLRQLVLRKSVLWDAPGYFQCTRTEDDALGVVPEVMEVEDLLQMVNAEIESAPYEFSNYALWCWPNDADGAKWAECGRRSESFALFDIRAQVRTEAWQNIVLTLTAVFVLIAFVFFFSYHTKGIFDNSVLNPLWKFLDEMCAARCLEVIAEEPNGAQLPASALGLGGRMRCMKGISCFDNVNALEELVLLDASFKKLRGAMRSWAKYVPKELFNAIVDAGIESGLGVIRSQVTILFVDVANLPELSKDLPPTQMLVLLGSVLQIIVAVVEELEGTVLEFIGDEVLAVFNAPSLVSDHTLKALMAAVEMQGVMRKRIRPVPQLNIGVHRDEVFVGNLGSASRMKYGVIGDGVNMTARLKSLNTRFSTGILTTSGDLGLGSNQLAPSPSVSGLTGCVGDRFVTRPVGNLVLKGRKTPTEIYEVLCKNNRKAPQEYIDGAELHKRAFALYLSRQFMEARTKVKAAHALLSHNTASPSGDLVTLYLEQQCMKYIQSPPGPDWDGSEQLRKKAW